MNTETLRTFITLAEVRNFTKTAQRHNIVQSTATTRIRELENELDIKLFFRDNKGVILTERGQQFLSYAKQIVECENRAIKDLREEPVYQEQVRLGVSHSIYACHLEKIVKRFLAENKKTSLDIKLNDSLQTIWSITDNIVDLGFGYTAFSGSSQLKCVPFRRERLKLVTSHKNRDLGHEITVDAFKTLPVVISNYAVEKSPSWYTDLFNESACFALRCNSGQQVIPILKTGSYYSILPESMVEEELDNGSLVEVQLTETEMPVLQCWIMYRESALNKDGARNFWALCTE